MQNDNHQQEPHASADMMFNNDQQFFDRSPHNQNQIEEEEEDDQDNDPYQTAFGNTGHFGSLGLTH